MNWRSRTLLKLLYGLIIIFASTHTSEAEPAGLLSTAASQVAPRVSPSDQLTVYLNEYQMLTARNTQWLTLQNGLWIILAAFIGLLIQVSGKLESATVLWLSLIAFELTLCAYSLIGCESYNNVFYLETALRPRVVELTGQHASLGYESFVQRNRPFPQWVFDYGLTIIATLVIAVALVLSKLPQRRRTLWLALVSILLIANLVLAYKAASARTRIPVDPNVGRINIASTRSRVEVPAPTSRPTLDKSESTISKVK